MAGLPQLTELVLSSPCLTHDGLAQLRSLQEIETLELGGPLIPSDLVNLQAMRNLNCLILTNTELRGQGLDALGNVPNLVDLRFYHDLINNSHLADLLAIPKLGNLEFWDTDVTSDAALAFQNAHPRMSASEYVLNIRVGWVRADDPVRPRPSAHPNNRTPPPSGPKP